MNGAPDFFYKEAQRLGYVARSAFKLLQIQKQHNLISSGSSVLDLGCAPGAWLQVACQSLGPVENGGVVVGIDLKSRKVQTICADVMSLSRNDIRALSPKQEGFSVVLSDMCPSVSGIITKDAALSFDLGMRALDLAVNDHGVLEIGGRLVIKLLESEDTREIARICKPLFKKTTWLRPKATRSSSREIYFICNSFKKLAE